MFCFAKLKSLPGVPFEDLSATISLSNQLKLSEFLFEFSGGCFGILGVMSKRKKENY